MAYHFGRATFDDKISKDYFDSIKSREDHLLRYQENIDSLSYVMQECFKMFYKKMNEKFVEFLAENKIEAPIDLKI